MYAVLLTKIGQYIKWSYMLSKLVTASDTNIGNILFCLVTKSKYIFWRVIFTESYGQEELRVIEYCAWEYLDIRQEDYRQVDITRKDFIE